MDKFPLVSVIVPAFNSENTILNVVNGLLSQTFKNFEIIIINDGSKDKTGELIDVLAERHHKRIRVYHQRNQGVSSARNLGIKKAQGEYITFIDSDDEIKFDFLQNLVKGIEEKNVDLVITGYLRSNGENVKLQNKFFSREDFQEVIMTKDIGVAVCKLYKRDIICENNIKFPEGMKLCEDAVFYYRYILHAKNCLMLNVQDYLYNIPENISKYNLNIDDEILALQEMSISIINLINNIKLDKQGIERLSKRLQIFFERVIDAITKQNKKGRKKYFEVINWSYLLSFLQIDKFSKQLLEFRLLKTLRIYLKLKKRIYN